MPLDLSRLPELVALICFWARERGYNLTTVQVVKYLYLADLYHARRHGGQTLTSLPWTFVHFGPYCSESIQAIDAAVDDRALVERLTYESSSGKDYYRYRVLASKEPALVDEIPYVVVSALKHAVRKYGDDTAKLLDYVYFDTEPMKDIEPYDRLDFGRARAPEIIKTVEPTKLTEKKRRKGLEIVDALRHRTMEASGRTPIDTGPYDDAYFEALDHDDAADVGGDLHITARLGDLRHRDDEE